MTLVEVSGLAVGLANSDSDIVANVTYSIHAGEIVGLVGESGSGKTTVGLALLGYARTGAVIRRGSVSIGDRNILSLGRNELRNVRGNVIGYVPQDPAAALNPALRIGRQFGLRPRRRVKRSSEAARRDRVLEALTEMGLPGDQAFLERFPHQISGGQQQRVCIAMAFWRSPRVVVLDEPTTGLDVTTQARILDTTAAVCSRHGVAALYVTHDLSVVATLARRLMVMYAGRIVEAGATTDILTTPLHPYTRGLVAAVPDIVDRRTPTAIAGHAPRPGARPAGCAFSSRCPAATEICRTDPPVQRPHGGRLVRCHHPAEVPVPSSPPPGPDTTAPRQPTAMPVLSMRHVVASRGGRRILHGVSLDAMRGECLGIVGESGSGKTTLARVIAGLLEPDEATLKLSGEMLAGSLAKRPLEARRQIQFIFQNPYASLNPRRTIHSTMTVPVKMYFGIGRRATQERIDRALDAVALPRDVLGRYPDELSGGERQRVAIARALICDPSLLVCDEITSALDVSIQAAIVHTLADLRTQARALSIVFITHDLALVSTLADRLLVMRAGTVVEAGDADSVLDSPGEDYTRELLAAIPRHRTRDEH
jgi:peptide/nickel transport system ATP-binding protein